MFAVRARHLFDGMSFGSGVTVLCEGERIVGVEPYAHVLPDGCEERDYGDATLLPGLIDSHVHLVGDNTSTALDKVAGFTGPELDAVVTDALHRHLVSGVTTVRDLGDYQFTVVARRDGQRARPASAADEPTIVAAGPPITSVRGHCYFLGGEAAGEDQLRAAVRDRADRGVDVIKVMASGGIVTRHTDILQPQFTYDELHLVVEEAHTAGLPVVAHAHPALAVRMAVEAGVDGVEHAGFMVRDEAGTLAARVDQAVLAEMARRGVAVCPTLGGLRSEDIRSAPADIAERLRQIGITAELIELRAQVLVATHEAGVRVVSGSDAGIAPPKAHGRYAEAVIELADILGTTTALVAATSVAADVCGIGDRVGSVATGRVADLLVVAGDLRRDLSTLRRPIAVLHRGVDVELLPG